MELGIGFEAFAWGIASAVSLPLGAVLGLWLRPRRFVNAAFTAFGAGALLFALTIELFSHVPHHVGTHGMGALAASVGGALAGGLLFDVLNQLLNNRGAFLRRLSSARTYLTRLQLRHAQRLVDELSRVKVLTHLKPEDMARLVHRVRLQRFRRGEVIFYEQGPADTMYFIIAGRVAITRTGDAGHVQAVAELGEDDTFGELALLETRPHAAEARALTDLRVLALAKKNLDLMLARSPELQAAITGLRDARMAAGARAEEMGADHPWREETIEHVKAGRRDVSVSEIREHGQGVHGAALAIWLGILIDGIPESLVIGMFAINPSGVSLSFIAGVFLANLPEAMASAVSMRNNGMNVAKIMMMWGSICVMTGIGAFIGASVLPAHPEGAMFYFVLGIEGLAAGAMLTMIAESMLPEAFEQGGSIIGLSTLAGFLVTLTVKVL